MPSTAWKSSAPRSTTAACCRAEWLRGADDMPIPVRAALAHVQLAGIHPSADGNGRTSRILASLVMYRLPDTRAPLDAQRDSIVAGIAGRLRK